MLSIDLNCDMGEGYPYDETLMDYVSSVNIACGYHAGDEETMRKTVGYAVKKGVAIGAHPSYPDREGFGRQARTYPVGELCDLIISQITALREICDEFGTKIHHVKPHGFLYNQSACNRSAASEIAEALFHTDPNLILFGLSGSRSISEARSLGLRTASEAFADRTYRHDGSLTPRTEPDALIIDAETAAEQALQIISDGNVTATTGETVEIKADTICIHGDGEYALAFAEAIHKKLSENAITIKAIND